MKTAWKQDLERSTLLVWDIESQPPIGDWTTVLWCSCPENDDANVVSIPKLVEEQADELRSRYLAWIYEIGETKIRSKRVIDHLQLQPDFSAWWISLLTEKCNFAKSPQIDDVIRLIAFTDWVNNLNVKHLLLVSSKKNLAQCFRLWCRHRKIGFEWQHCPKEHSHSSPLYRLYTRLPYFLQALIWLVHQTQSRWSLRGVGLPNWWQSKAQITFVSYLFNLRPEAAAQGVFESSYWGHLPDVLHREGLKTNWLHLYIKDSLLPTAKDVAQQIYRFNQTRADTQNHVTLDSFLSLTVIFTSLRDWFHLLSKIYSLPIHKHIPKLSELDLWPLFKNDWNNSVVGSAAMSNLLTLNLFNAAFSQVSKQSIGVYLQENQGWEFGMLQAWKSNHHDQIIGCAHTTVRYWDLRYFFDPRSYHSTQQSPMPMPNWVAVNGSASQNNYLEGGYPSDKLIEVEALRFLYLNQAVEHSFTQDSDIERSVAYSPVPTLRLLVLSDYTETNSRVQMDLLNEIADQLPQGITITVKPHPACPIRHQDYPLLSFSISTSPIAKLLENTDIAYTSPTTSAAVEAYCAGIPVITVLNHNTLNMSPLRGYDNVKFVGTSAELAKVLGEAMIKPRAETKSARFFNLDMGLPKWRKILGLPAFSQSVQ